MSRLFVGVLAIALAACSQSPQESASTSTPASGGQADAASNAKDAQAEAAAAANAGTMVPLYAATIAEGFDFTKPGAPDFLVAASGISGVESWGRWTDANLGPVVFRFRDALPQDFTLKLKVRDFFGLNAGQQITVRAGAQEQTFVLPEGQGDQAVELKFAGTGGVDTIEMVIPKTSEPTETDTRKIGLGLVSMSIQN